MGDTAAGFSTQLAELIGCDGQAREGQLTVILAEAEGAKTNRGGLVPWISTHLDVTAGKARGIARPPAKSATFPILENPSRPAGSVRIRSGQRRDRRSFVRVAECEKGMSRFEILLDDARATTLRTAVDHQVSAVLRARQCDGTELVPADVKSVEQLQAHALTRFAEMYVSATAERRRTPYTAHIVHRRRWILPRTADSQIPATALWFRVKFVHVSETRPRTCSNTSTGSPRASMGNFSIRILHPDSRPPRSASHSPGKTEPARTPAAHAPQPGPSTLST